MHTKLITETGGGTQILSVKPSWREHFLAPELEWAESQPHPLFLDAHHDTRGHTIAALYLHITNMRRLDDVLEDGITEELFVATLVAVADVIGACICAGRNAGFLYLDASMIYLGPDGHPRFPYIPLESQGRVKDEVPEGHLVRLLEQLADDSNPSRSDRVTHWRRSISDYTHRSLEYLTMRSYCSLLELTLGLSLYPTALAAVDILNQRDPQYASSMYRRAPRQQAPSHGQWRGVNLRGSFNAFVRDGAGLGTGQTEDYGESASWNTPIEPPKVSKERKPIGRGSTKPAIGTSASGDSVYLVRVQDGSRYPLGPDRVVRLGRGSKNDIQLLGNPKVSRNHAVVRRANNGITLQDLGSANGTWIEGRRLQPQESVVLSLNQHFFLANEELIVRRD